MIIPRTRLLLAPVLIFLGLQGHALAQGSGSGSAPPALVDSGSATVALVDAGVPTTVISNGSGTVTATSTTATTPTGTTTTQTLSLPNPTMDPVGFYNALKDFWSKGGWLLLAGGALLGLLELAAFAGTKSNIAWLAWLGKGRISIVISGGITLVGGLVNALATGGWSAFIIGALGAVTTYFHLAGTDPTKAINPVTEDAPTIILPAARVVK